jgi:hypothetical protein
MTFDFKKPARTVLVLSIFIWTAHVIRAQSGGKFQLEQTVVSSGGTANGGTFSLSFVVGEPNAGKGITGGHFFLSSGFWPFAQLAPTAAPVSVAGRAMTAGGQPLVGVRVSLLNSAGVFKTVRTNTFGYFRFNDVPAGQTYILAAVSKEYEFASQVVTALNDIADLNLIALD